MTINAAILGLRKPQTTSDKQAIAKADMQIILAQCASQINSSYGRLMRLVYNNEFGLTQQQVIANLSQEEIVLLRKQAILIKTLINSLLPGTINDVIPEATITYPENLFPE